MRQTLRGFEGDLVITIPREFIDRNGLTEGSRVELHLAGKKMTVEVPSRPSYRVADLVAEMPEGLPRVQGWEQMPSVGAENDTGTTESARNGLLQFAASQKNIDRLAIRLGVCVAILGAMVAIATIVAILAK